MWGVHTDVCFKTVEIHQATFWIAGHFNRLDFKIKKRESKKKLLIVSSYSKFQICSLSINFEVFASEVNEKRPS